MEDRISPNVWTLSKRLLLLGVPGWFFGLIFTESISSGFDGPSAVEVAFATLLMLGGMIAIGSGLTGLVVGAAVADVIASRKPNAALPPPPPS